MKICELGNYSNDWIWEINVDWIFTYSNQNVASILGYCGEKLQGLKLDKLVHPDDIQQIKTQIIQLVAGNQESQSSTARFRCKDGGFRYLDITLVPKFNSEGTAIGFGGISRDVSFFLLQQKSITSLLSSDSYEKSIQSNMAEWAEYFRVDVFELWMFDDNREHVQRVHQWGRHGITPSPSTYRIADIPWITNQVLAGQVVQIPDVTNLPIQAGAERAAGVSVGASAVLIVPLLIGSSGNRHIGTGVASVRGNKRNWTEKMIAEFQFAFNSIAAAMFRNITEKENAERGRFQKELTELSSRLIQKKPNEIQGVVKNILEKISRSYKVDGMALWLSNPPPISNPFFFKWTKEGMHGPKDLIIDETNTPWTFQKTIHDNGFYFETIDEIPAEEYLDRSFFQNRGVKSLLILPVRIEGNRVGRTVLFTVEQARTWPDKAIRELNLLLHPILSAIVRAEMFMQLRQSQLTLARAEALSLMGSFYLEWDSKHDNLSLKSIVRCSSELQRMLHLECESIDLELLTSKIHPEDREAVLHAWTGHFKNHGSREQLEFRIVRPDGTIRHIESQVESRCDTSSGRCEMYGALSDVSAHFSREHLLTTVVSKINQRKQLLELENRNLRNEIRAAHKRDPLIGKSPALQRCLDLVQTVAPTNVTVLILGETGVGKELIAHRIHELSPRSGRGMISVNCAALPENLIENELFGHEKGAYTDASSLRRGRFELANGSTIFLDEIAEIPLPLQSKLLRVIQEGEFERVGGSKTLKVDVRVIASTNQDLKNMLEHGKFRADLYYRISNFPIFVPPLRERKEDIPLIVQYFVDKYGTELGKTIESVSPELMRYICDQPWLGNIRELAGFIQRAVITNNDDILSPNVIEPSNPLGSIEEKNQFETRSETLSGVTKTHIIEVLKKTDWVIAGEKGAAKILGVPPSTLRSKMESLGIRKHKSETFCKTEHKDV